MTFHKTTLNCQHKTNKNNISVSSIFFLSIGGALSSLCLSSVVVRKYDSILGLSILSSVSSMLLSTFHILQIDYIMLLSNSCCWTDRFYPNDKHIPLECFSLYAFGFKSSLLTNQKNPWNHLKWARVSLQQRNGS